ncbi:6-bladed beta-propeller [Algoriphagus sp. D3-2-R+10]|uniref:6-bladed beta-propeller n=1 Tax=Algoriphagus aurantiacus TaxID=3103948 RepID=UPI002B3906BD|nr:6-bladed beta-propeller [Algoriphagus sp. D3-2-R+10]MEB2776852.1 6-bladed beta-propeller [Algoriphagus sp. D3-2-R+10]
MTKNREFENWTQLSPTIQYESLNDSTYLFDIRNIVAYKDNFLLVNTSGNTIYLVSESYALKEKIGEMGDGPGQYYDPQRIVFENDTLWVGDSGNQRINAYNLDGNYLLSFKTPEPFSLANGEFTKNGTYFYFHTLDGANSIIKYNYKTDAKSYFGNYTGDTNDRNSIFMNDALTNLHLTKKGDILTVNCQNSNINIYTSDGSLLHNYTYPNLLSNFKENIAILEQTSRERSDSYVMIQNSYLDNDYLYLLLTSRIIKNTDSFSPNKIIKINVENGEITDYYDLPDKVYLSVSAVENKLFAFNKVNSKIEVYNME